MHQKIVHNSLIEQEKRAAILFLILLLSVIFAIDLFGSIYSDESYGWEVMIPYIPLYMLIPMATILIRRQNPGSIKYIFFLTYIVVGIIVEPVLFWGGTAYTGGNAAEVFFVLLSPIFINKKYYLTVTIGVFSKYLLVGLLLQTTIVLIPMAILILLDLVAFLFLNRFIGYVNALDDSYSKKIDDAVSTGTALINQTIKDEIIKIQHLSSRLLDLNANLEVEQADKVIDTIQLSTLHMLNMSNQLKEKTEAIDLHDKEHNLNSIVQAAVDMVKPYFEKNRIQCNLKLKYEAVVLCDQAQIQKGLVNLIMNAIEAMERNGGVLSIRLLKVKKDVVVQIEDTGHGIPNDIRSHIFEPFFTTKMSHRQLGLGLSYCNNVIQKHGGSVAIHSEEGVGTIVAIRIPHHRLVRVKNKAG